jgi:hypothetical protein
MPSALARLRPAMTRSRIIARSNSAKHAQHLEHGPAGRRRRVEALLVQEQVDALGVEFTEEVQQVDQGAAQAIDRPCRDHVDVAAGNGLEQAIEARALVAALGAGDTGVLEKLDHAPAVARGDRFQFTALVFGRLLVIALCGACDPLHGLDANDGRDD